MALLFFHNYYNESPFKGQRVSRPLQLDTGCVGVSCCRLKAPGAGIQSSTSIGAVKEERPRVEIRYFYFSFTGFF